MRVSSDSVRRRILSAPSAQLKGYSTVSPTAPVGRELDRGPMFSGHMMPGQMVALSFRV